MISEEIREKRLENGAKTHKQPKLFLNFGEMYFLQDHFELQNALVIN